MKINSTPETFYSKKDSLALLATEGGLQRFEKHLKSWMKKIQASLGNQIEVETMHIKFRSYSLKASNYEGRLTTWDLRSLLEILCNQCWASTGAETF